MLRKVAVVPLALAAILAAPAAVASAEANAKSEANKEAAGDEKKEKECLFERPARDDSPRICIRPGRYAEDLCRTIERFAVAHELPPEYFARLIWRESLFRADAVSPKGAEGIAQFMPATAKRRGLTNSFDAVAALDASAKYLKELSDRFGNLGLAAAAYNAGEEGLARFLDKGRLPLETRDYVFAITGHPVETWRDTPPKVAAPALDPDKPFLEGCVKLAVSRRLREPVLMQSADWAPWGVQLSAHFDPGIASRLFVERVARLPSPLSAERALIVPQKPRKIGMRQKYAARIGRQTRKEALTLCDRILSHGVACAVVKN